MEKAQAERLEEAREEEIGLRSTWWAGQRAKWEDEVQPKEDAEDWAWGSWSRSDRRGDTSQEDRSASSGLQGRVKEARRSPPEAVAEPTASAGPLPMEDFQFPNRTREEDLTALRAAAITPVSFAPQRHVTMALGRPIVVLSWI